MKKKLQKKDNRPFSLFLFFGSIYTLVISSFTIIYNIYFDNLGKLTGNTFFDVATIILLSFFSFLVIFWVAKFKSKV